MIKFQSKILVNLRLEKPGHFCKKEEKVMRGGGGDGTCLVKYESFSGHIVPDGQTDQWERRESTRAHTHTFPNSVYGKSAFLNQ